MLRPLFYCDHHEIPLPSGHKFPIRKYRIIRELLARSRCFAFVPSEPAPLEAIERVHDTTYVRDFVAGTLSPAVLRRIGFPWSEGLVRRTLASVGGSMDNVVKLVTYMTDLEQNADAYREVRASFFPNKSALPASTLLQITRLANPSYLIEVDATAILPPRA